MKILLDPIYTSDPSHCASNVKMKKVCEYLMAEYDDIFFYWLVPEWATDEELEWYPQSDRIQLIKYPYSKDRMREYLRVDRSYERLVNFQGELWDIDIFITTRTAMVPLIKGMANRPNRTLLEWSKRIFLIEDMPMMSFKLHVAVSHRQAQDVQTLLGYLTADDVAISAFWEKDIILKEARSHLSMSAIRKIKNKMVESSPVLVSDTELKKPQAIGAWLSEKRPFTVGYVGRMTHNNKADDIFEIMGKHWIYRAKDKVKIRCLAMTQSFNSGRVNLPDYLEVQRLPREEFWDTVKNKMDVFIFLSPEVDYSMSLMEPLILGCPVILCRNRWSIPTVGDDYPFFVETDKQAYALVRAFYEDYANQYAKFAKWSKESLEPLMRQRNAVYLPYLVEESMKSYERDYQLYISEHDSLIHNEITQTLVKYADEHNDELVVWDAIEELGKEGVFRFFEQKIKADFREKVRLTWGTDWNQYRIGLRMLGFVDASVKTGHMRRA